MKWAPWRPGLGNCSELAIVRNVELTCCISCRYFAGRSDMIKMVARTDGSVEVEFYVAAWLGAKAFQFGKERSLTRAIP